MVLQQILLKKICPTCSIGSNVSKAKVNHPQIYQWLDVVSINHQNTGSLLLLY